jgi:uncharacterized membrane protein
MEKKMVIRYLVLVLIFVVLFVGLFFLRNVSFTGQVIYEETADERGSYWNRVDNGGGNYSIAVYQSAINYFDGSNYTPINTGLNTTSCGASYDYCVNANLYQAQFKINVDWGVPVEIIKDSYYITYEPSDMAYGNTNGIEAEYIGNLQSVQGNTHRNSFNYSDAFPETDLLYSYAPKQLKEIFVLKQLPTPPAQYVLDGGNVTLDYSFILDYHVGIEMYAGGINREGTNFQTYDEVEFRNSSGDVVVYFSKPYAYDSNGSVINVFYQIRRSGNSVFAYIRTNYSWLNSSERVFPVYIDPTTAVGVEEGGEDSYVESSSPDKNYGDSDGLQVGNVDTSRAYLLFNISAIPESQKIDEAVLCSHVGTKKDQTINSNHVYIDFDESTVTWNNQPCGPGFNNPANCNLTSESSVLVDGSSQDTWKCWDVTNMVNRDYRNEEENVAIILSTGDDNINEFRSKESTDPDLWPYLNITYSFEDNGPPIIVLNSPTSFTDSEGVVFDYTPTDANIDTCELWGNFTGSWDKNQTDSSVTSGSSNLFNLDLEEVSYFWAIWCNDSLGNFTLSNNQTFTIDTTFPNLTLSEPSGSKDSRTVTSNWYVSDDNLDSCWYNVYQGASLEIANTTIDCSLGTTSFDVSTDASFTFNFYAGDLAGNVNSTSSSFSVQTTTSTTTTVVTSSTSTGRTDLDITQISDLVLEPGESKEMILVVENSGNEFLNDCKVKGYKDSRDWIAAEELRGFSAGEEYGYVFTLNLPESLETGSYQIDVGLFCQEYGEEINFTVEIIKRDLSIDLINVNREDDEDLKVTYFISELSDYDQEVEIEIVLFGSNDERLAELTEIRSLTAGELKEFETIVKIDKSLVGNFNLLINAVSDTASTFVQEEIILGSSSNVGGLAILGGEGAGNILSIVLLVLFAIFAGIMGKRIFKFKKLKKSGKLKKGTWVDKKEKTSRGKVMKVGKKGFKLRKKEIKNFLNNIAVKMGWKK